LLKARGVTKLAGAKAFWETACQSLAVVFATAGIRGVGGGKLNAIGHDGSCR
jgi:hypothetical protein